MFLFGGIVFYLKNNLFKAGQSVIQRYRKNQLYDFLPDEHIPLLDVNNSVPMVIKMVDRLNGIYYIRYRRDDPALRDRMVEFADMHRYYVLTNSGWTVKYVGK